MKDVDATDIADSIATLATMIAEQFDRVEQRFTQIEQRLEQIEERFEQIERHFVRIESRLDRIESDIRQVSIGQIDMHKDIKHIDGNTRATINDIVEIYNRLTKLETGPATP